MIKLIAFDIDGTLVPKESYHVPEDTKLLLQKIKERGILLVLASGRHHTMVNKELKKIGIDYYISCCGGYIMDRKENLIYISEIPAAVKKRLETEVFASGGALEYRYVEGSDLRFGSEILQDYAKHFLSDAQLQDIKSYIPKENEFPMSALCFLPERYRKKIISSFPMLDFREAGTDGFFDVTSMGTNKGAAMSRLCNWLHIAQNETAAFGDDMNDISMVEYAGMGIAMGNAAEALKAVSDYVTSACDDHGIANAISNLDLLSPRFDNQANRNQ